MATTPEEDILSQAPAHLEGVLSTLRELQRRLDVEMNSGLAASAGAGINPNHVRMGVQLATASAQLGREVRAWSKRVRELSASAPLEQKVEAVIRFLQELNPVERLSILSKVSHE